MSFTIWTWIKFKWYCWCWCLHIGTEEEVKGWKETWQLVICFHSLLKQNFSKKSKSKINSLIFDFI